MERDREAGPKQRGVEKSFVMWSIPCDQGEKGYNDNDTGQESQSKF